MRLSNILVFLFIGSCFSVFSQARLTAPNSKGNSPEWVQLMYSSNPNVHEVRNAYEDFYRNNEFVKNQDTQYYKRWMRERISRTNKEGIYSQEEIESNRSFYTQLRASSNLPGEWEEMGPWQYDHEAALLLGVQSPGSSHIYTVEQSELNTDLVYAGSANAGLWKSTDKGLHWELKTRDLWVNTVYAIALDPSDEDIVYFGEGNGGIWKSVDGGENWSATGNAAFQTTDRWVRDLKISPVNSNLLYAATSDGLYASSNGGASWILMESGEFMEIEFKPNDANTIYAVQLNGDGTTFFKSTDGGINFSATASGWPSPVVGDEQKRCEIAVTASNPDKIYVLASGYADGYGGLYGIYVSEDSGENFQYQCCGTGPGGMPDATSNKNILGWSGDGAGDGGQYYYDLALGASPSDEEKIFGAGISMWRSEDQGVNWELNGHWVTWAGENTLDRYTHADVHDIKFYDTGAGVDMWIASDGGLYYSSNEGDNIEPRMYGIHGTDFWGFKTGFQDGGIMVGGTYHNGTLIKNNDVYHYGSEDELSGGWFADGAGDNIRGFVNPGNDIGYDDGGSFSFSDERLVRRSSEPFNNDFRCTSFYWTGEYGNYEWDPLCYNHFYSPVNNEIYKTEDGGLNWSLVHQFEGEKVIQIKVAPQDNNRIYCTVAENYWSHHIWTSGDGGLNWVNITPNAGLTDDNSWRHKYVEVDYENPLLIWTILIGNQTGNKVFRSDDAGANWTDYSGPSTIQNAPLNYIHRQAGTNEGLYVGSSVGVFYRNASMDDWEMYSDNLPLSAVSYFLQPYYGGGKIRTAGNNGVHQNDFFEPSNPVANFSVDKLEFNLGVRCENEPFIFNDQSILLIDENTTWNWEFEGGTPSVSEERNPEVFFDQEGSFDVTLTVSQDGVTSTLVREDYIVLTSQGVEFPLNEDFEVSFPPVDWVLKNEGTSAWEHDWVPAEEGDNKVASYPNYWVNSSGLETRMISQAFDFTDAVGPLFSFDYTHRKYADYNDSLSIDYRLDGTGEWIELWKLGGEDLNVPGTDMFWWYDEGSTVEWVNVEIDLTDLVGQECIEFSVNNIGDYGNHIWVDNINIDSAPRADFEADVTVICLQDNEVGFTDLSINNPETYLWEFTPNTVTYLIGDFASANPTVSFDEVGVYDVSLTVTNATGDDIELKTEYIVIEDCGCPTDLDNNGVTNIGDLLVLLSAYGCMGEDCIGDFNDDNQTDAADFVIFLPAYGQLCD